MATKKKTAAKKKTSIVIDPTIVIKTKPSTRIMAKGGKIGGKK